MVAPVAPAPRKYTGQWIPGNASSYGSQNPSIPQAGPPGMFGSPPLLGKNTPGNWAGIFGDTGENTLGGGLAPAGGGSSKAGIKTQGLTPNGLPNVPSGAISGSSPTSTGGGTSSVMSEIMGFAQKPYASPEDIARKKTTAYDELGGAEQDTAMRLGQYAGAMGFGASGGIQAGQRRLSEDFSAQRQKASNDVEDWASNQERQRARDRLSAMGLAGNLEMSSNELAAKQALAEAQMGHETSLQQARLDWEKQQAEEDRKLKLMAMAQSMFGQRGGGGGGGGEVSQQSVLGSRATKVPGMSVNLANPVPFNGRF